MPQPAPTASLRDTPQTGSAPVATDLEADAVARNPAADLSQEQIEKLAKEARIRQLAEEGWTSSSCYVEERPFGIVFEYFPHAAIALAALIVVVVVADRRKSTRRTNWRSWLRGRF